MSETADTLTAEGKSANQKILEGLNTTEEGDSYCIDANYHKRMSPGHFPSASGRTQVKSGIRIRKLTPVYFDIETTGFSAWAFECAAEVNSDTQLYKQAGNSVTVPVIYEIAKRLRW